MLAEGLTGCQFAIWPVRSLSRATPAICTSGDASAVRLTPPFVIFARQPPTIIEQLLLVTQLKGAQLFFVAEPQDTASLLRTGDRQLEPRRPAAQDPYSLVASDEEP